MTLPLTTPNWFDSSETGAPVINNAAGSLLAAVVAVAVDGFNVCPVLQVSVTSEVATAMCLGHGYSAAYGKLVKLSGVSVPALNGNKQLTGVSTDAFTYAAPGVADGVYDTGSMEARRAPLGWEVAYTGTNIKILRRTAPESTAMLLRIADTGATNARVLMVESATAVSTYSSPSPTNAQVSGGLYWCKGANDTTAKQWAMVGNDRFLWFFAPVPYGADPYMVTPQHFGDLFPYATPDPYACILCGATLADAWSYKGVHLNNYLAVAESYEEVIARGKDLTTKSVQGGKHGPGAIQPGVFNQLPTNTDVVPVYRPIHYSQNDMESPTGGIRGEVPGLAAPMARTPFLVLGQFATVTPAVGEGRTYLSVLYDAGSGYTGNALIDLTGPWYG